MPTTYHVVVPSGMDDHGHPVSLEPAEAPNADSARRRQRLARTNTGAVAFNRTGDPGTGEFGDAEIIAVFGSVDVRLLADAKASTKLTRKSAAVFVRGGAIEND